VATALNDSDEIRRRMAQIRRELHVDIQEVVAGAEAVVDWRRHIRTYPWAAVGAAVVVGYLVVPKRRRSVPRDVARQSDVAAVREVLEQGIEPEIEEKKRPSLIASAFKMLAPLAWRVAQNYALGSVDQWMAAQQYHAPTEAGPPPPPPPGPRQYERRP
jgi:hypothetical protein